VLDAVSGQPSADWSRQRAPPRVVAPPRTPVPRPTYKCPHGLSRITSHALTLAQARDHRRSLQRASATVRQATRASATVASPPQSTILARLASLETREGPQALKPNRTSLETPNHPRQTSSSRRRRTSLPAHVDRVSLYAIFQFLTCTASASPGQAS
jgi:hypothetical protein